jgi:glycosyltransferase involved in cell wall biosynthesis
MKLWIDVEDLFQYASHVKRPSGIQRLTCELSRALITIAPGDVHLVRHGKRPDSFVTVPFSAVEALFAGAGSNAKPAARSAAPVPLTPARSSLTQRAMAALPPAVQQPARQFRLKQAEAFHALADFLRAISRQWIIKPLAQTTGVLETSVEFVSAPGDWLVWLGAPWAQADYAARVAALCQPGRLRLAILIHDIIPLWRPEWFDSTTRQVFAGWFRSTAPLADAIFAVSRRTAADVERYAAQNGLRLRAPVYPVPVGAGVGLVPPERTRRLPEPASYVLCVATIEARKNHALLFRIWRELLDAMPAEQIPTLVFAGRAGWLVQDLMQQLDNTDWLNGKILWVESPSDGELAALYQYCLFTIFPSFYEGWGLPVTESLAHGAPCLAANRTSLPEAGGNLTRYFNPDNLAEAISAVREIIENPAQLQDWRALILREFQPVPWSKTAAAVLDRLQL